MTMNMNSNTASEVRFDADAVRINGQSAIMLSASLFYFRIPKAYWKERMEQLKAFGYNCIDVYFPWNYHELSEGDWDFTGDRDVATFLKAASDTGIWVIARPGPYICSEWDGGALPAYLFAKSIKLRDNNPSYLNFVSKWFERILPLLKANQIGQGGTVIGVQLDNELDFYDCTDPLGYIAALRDMALHHGITVPLFACAGQGGLFQASGLADGVMPTCNFYPNDRDPEFEAKVSGYREKVNDMGYPLLVTETNRTHYLLRRLLSCGAKLLGPYLQVSGTDFGFTNATNNWGNPLAFMTSDYDFGGMISPEGHIRQEAYEGRLLSRMIEAYGAPLAEASACRLDLHGAAGDTAEVSGSNILVLNGGGRLLFVTNLGKTDKELKLAGTAHQQGFTLKAGRSLALPMNVPLAHWGLSGELVGSTAELFMAQANDNGAVLAFHTEGKGEIVLRVDGFAGLTGDNSTTRYDDGRIIITFDGKETLEPVIMLANNQSLKLVITDREHALYAERMDETGSLLILEPVKYAGTPEEAVPGWRLGSLDPTTTLAGGSMTVETADNLELHGIYRGYAWYECSVTMQEEAEVKGILVRSGSDVISLYAGGQYAGTVTPGGGSRYMPLSSGFPGGKLTSRVEIWGHSNFDDIRLPGLRLHAMKGIKGLMAVTAMRDISSNWSVFRAKDGVLREDLAEHSDLTLWPVVQFGGWLSADHPAHEYYRKSLQLSGEASAWTLHFEGLQSLAHAFVNGLDAGVVNPFDPYLDISPYVSAGETADITVYVERVLGLPSGKVILYEGTEGTDWSLSSAEEQGLLAHAALTEEKADEAALPITLESGGMAWLYGSLVNSEAGKGWRVTVKGTGLKLTVFAGERITGRLWLPGGSGRPVFRGGSQESFYVPGSWIEENEGALAILLEAVDGDEPGKLESFAFVTV